ncbi:hypothetical protein [Desulfovibrio gilichinskyi]|uniref:Uncharacterized protein n=1 Tax=Desulfovibrio gilichinskyi TaxID=1519643 RepID=A0A1X7C4C7_9BACT|nr:hypothetical protein [Desulfovibrio gilichinskyi]SME89354.1 hypothetical protein SAMN06295933_0281 [Desulfovibrio gilichinskyi]
MRKILLLFFIVAFAASGCAFKTISDLPAEDQAVEYANFVLDSYNATYHKYNEIKHTIPAEQNATAVSFVKAMNNAKPAVLALSYAAESWKTATVDDSAKAELVYRQQRLIAADILDKAMDLWAKLNGDEE